MQETSKLYKEILAVDHTTEISLSVDGSGPDNGYDEHSLFSLKTSSSVFSEDGPEVGCCVSREIDVRMLKPSSEISTNARLEPFFRITDGNRRSEWIQKGRFYIDTRESEESDFDSDVLHIHGFCDMLRTEADYPSSSLKWPARDIDVIREICRTIGVELDPRVIQVINKSYPVELPLNYSMREVLSGIGAMYGICWIMSDTGKLQPVSLLGLPAETNYLISENYQYITFGGLRIHV